MLIGCIALVSAVAALAVCGLVDGFASLAWLWILPVTFLGGVLVLCGGVFAFLMILCRRVDQNVPQEEDDPLYRTFSNLVIRSVLPILRIRVKVSGMDKVPQSGRFLLVCNHCNDSDPIILLKCFKKYQLAFISKQENQSMFVIGPMMHKLQCQLINRENDREALKTILNCIKILKEDRASVAVFPEGGILSEDGKLHHFRPGVFKIAQKAKVPIVVCTLRNTKDVVHNILHFKGSKVELRVLETISASELASVTTVDIAERCHKLMADDLGPELVAD